MAAVISINRIRLEFKDANGPCTVISALSINRIRLEFKVAGTEFKVNNRECINRIRLEFKGGQHPRHCPNRPARINRIRLEFKDNGRRRKGIPMVVLIESDWNLKRNRKTG